VKISFGGFPPKEVFLMLSRSYVLCVLKGVAFLEEHVADPGSFEGSLFRMVGSFRQNSYFG
jgi:hypothetical protein